MSKKRLGADGNVGKWVHINKCSTRLHHKKKWCVCHFLGREPFKIVGRRYRDMVGEATYVIRRRFGLITRELRMSELSFIDSPPSLLALAFHGLKSLFAREPSKAEAD